MRYLLALLLPLLALTPGCLNESVPQDGQPAAPAPSVFMNAQDVQNLNATAAWSVVCGGPFILPLNDFMIFRVLPSVYDTTCGRDASSCDEFLACLGYDLASDCAVERDRCDGDVLVECSSTRQGWLERRIPCRQTCGSNADGMPVCDPCEAGQSPGLWCDGTLVVGCDLRSAPYVDCADQGLTCAEEGQFGSAVCVDPQKPCTSNMCRGDVAVRCHSGFEQRFDCKAYSEALSCAMVNGQADCVADQCSSTFTSGTCDGSTYTFCVKGAFQRIDCSDYAGGTCVEGDNSSGCASGP